MFQKGEQEEEEKIVLFEQGSNALGLNAAEVIGQLSENDNTSRKRSF